MKKTFVMSHPKIKVPRLLEAAKGDINKYLKRERKKDLPNGFDFWDFDCKFGDTAEEAKAIHVTEFGKHIDRAGEKKAGSFYVEILAKPVARKQKS